MIDLAQKRLLADVIANIVDDDISTYTHIYITSANILFWAKSIIYSKSYSVSNIDTFATIQN